MKPYVKSVAASQEMLDAVSASEATKLNQTQVDARVEAVTGKLSNLTTTAKTNLVAAINEAAASGGVSPEAIALSQGEQDSFDDAIAAYIGAHDIPAIAIFYDEEDSDGLPVLVINSQYMIDCTDLVGNHLA